MRNLAKGWPIFLGILTCLFISNAKANPLQCGKDVDCFIKAAKTCSSAEMRYTSNGPLLLLKGTLTATSQLQIHGMNEGKCFYSGTVVDAKVTHDKKWQRATTPYGTVDPKELKKLETIASQDLKTVGLGLNIICELSPPQLTEQLAAMKENLFVKAVEGDVAAVKKWEKMAGVKDKCLVRFPNKKWNGNDLNQFNGPAETADPNLFLINWFSSRS